jgi:hypothetical protein
MATIIIMSELGHDNICEDHFPFGFIYIVSFKTFRTTMMAVTPLSLIWVGMVLILSGSFLLFPV